MLVTTVGVVGPIIHVCELTRKALGNDSYAPPKSRISTSFVVAVTLTFNLLSTTNIICDP